MKQGAIPSIFSWTEEPKSNEEFIDTNNSNQENDFAMGEIIEDSFQDVVSDAEVTVQDLTETDTKNATLTNNLFDCDLDVPEEIVSTCEIDNIEQDKTENSVDDVVTDTKKDCSKNIVKVKEALFDIKDLKDEPRTILEFTGLENYHKFMTLFYSLGRKVHDLRYPRNGAFKKLSLKNQLFLTLWKLRKNCTDNELSIYFSISKVAVGNIFKTWIVFMANQWSKIDIWPSKQLVKYYMPENFKLDFPNTRVIIDGTEIHVQRSRDPRTQQSTFSYYKNDTTLKAIVGTTPGGLFSYCSQLYGGSTSDRQLVERSGLQNKCEPGDMVMADRGFTVQDIFAPYNVTVAIPHFTRGKGYIPLRELLMDRKLSRYRVHVERIIVLMKTYKIMSTKLNKYYVPLASEISQVCMMLCNFKECIMRKNKNKPKAY